MSPENADSSCSSVLMLPRVFHSASVVAEESDSDSEESVSEESVSTSSVKPEECSSIKEPG
ncbi:hypothetical protein CFP56_042761 [Quercus suber]|uniref:Uncharacterized protein n=1 Tax=Quercus suber TaxID=58331 RepID=A0AAW0ITP6_QUESU